MTGSEELDFFEVVYWGPDGIGVLIVPQNRIMNKGSKDKESKYEYFDSSQANRYLSSQLGHEVTIQSWERLKEE